MEPFVVFVILSEAEFARLIVARYLRSAFYLIVVFATIVLTLMAIFSNKNVSDFLFCSYLSLFCLPILSWVSAIRMHRSRPSSKHGMSYAISDENVYASTEGMSSFITWKNMLYMQEINGYLLLFPSRTNIYILPKKQLSVEQIEFIKRMMRTKR